MSDSLHFPSLCIDELLNHSRTEGAEAARKLIRRVLQQVATSTDPAIWISRLPEQQVLAQLDAAERRLQAGEVLPLFGVPFAVKDNIDVAGCPTTAACPAFAYTPDVSAPAVGR